MHGCRRCLIPSGTTGHSRKFGWTSFRSADYTHAIVGAGVVGLAIARQLAARSGSSTLLIERNGDVGIETSSRSSEVIHAGLYYGDESLKTKLCISGKRMLYQLCSRYRIPHREVGKWIVAHDEKDLKELEKMHEFSKRIDGVPTSFITANEAARKEPDVQARWVLESPTTGIIDSHAYMQCLLALYEDRHGVIALNTSVTNVIPLGQNGSTGWEIWVEDSSTGEKSVFTTETIINSAGLSACRFSNMILPPFRHRTSFYAKGNYFAYSTLRPRSKRLIYPTPNPVLGGLGTHLTLDLTGRIRFGPDVQWVGDPSDLAVDASRLPQALDEIRKYLPGVKEDAVHPDYAGIRPKLMGLGAGFQDFVICKEDDFKGFVNLLGIESPGLTASLAIGELVENLLYG